MTKHSIQDSVILDNYDAMLEYQEKHHGQAAPYRYLMRRFGLSSTFSVHYRVKILEELGMVVPSNNLKHPRYVAVKKPGL